MSSNDDDIPKFVKKRSSGRKRKIGRANKHVDIKFLKEKLLNEIKYEKVIIIVSSKGKKLTNNL